MLIKFKESIIMLMLLMVLLCCAGAVSAASDNTMDNDLSEVNSGNDFISVSMDDQTIGGEDSAVFSYENGSLLSVKSNDNEILSVGSDLLSADNNENGNILREGEVAANTWYVDANAASGGDGKSEATAFQNLEYALNEAVDNDTIMIASGTYIGDKNIGLTIDKILSLEKYGAGEAIFDAQNNPKIFTINATRFNIMGLTFQNGYQPYSPSDYRGIINFENTISNSIINATYFNNTMNFFGGSNQFRGKVINSTITGTYINNYAFAYGAANYFSQEVINSTVTGTYINNNAERGGANYFSGSVYNSTINGTYINNTATIRFEIKYYGGANYFKGTYNSTINGTYINNTAKTGGANYFDADSVVSDSTLTGIYINNTAEWGGANSIAGMTNSVLTGIYIKNDATVDDGGANCIGEMTNSVLTGIYVNNTAMQGGGAIYIGTIEGSTINGTYINNTAYCNGYRCGGGAIESYEALNSNITGTYINNAADGDGGVILFGYFLKNVNISGLYINNTAKGNGTLCICHWAPSYNTTNSRIHNAIFLNNKYDENAGIFYNVNDDDLVAIDNWFGNDDTNYETAPKTTNVEMNGWLFINGTIERNDIKFYLTKYDNTTDKTSEYDNSLLPKVNLTITSTIEIDKYMANFGDSITFYPSNNQFGSVTAKIEDITKTIEFNIGDFNLLQDLINRADENSVINLESNYAHRESDIIFDDVLIDKNITINGNGFIIDANEKSRIFTVTAESINITNVTLKNGNAEHGGAIYFENAVCNANINATFINNTARYGGASYFCSDVTNSAISGTYTSNNATQAGGINHFGWDVINSNITGTYNYNTAENGGINYFYNSVADTNINGTYINNKGRTDHFLWDITNTTITGRYINNSAGSYAIITIDKPVSANISNAIFLNNKYNETMGVIYAKKTGAVATDNWFGNNATNYETEPNTQGIHMASWLFLNGTNNQNNIKFFLMSYNGTTTSEYDNTLLSEINLTVTTTDGTLEKSIVGLDETVKFYPAEGGINRVTAQIEDAAQTIEVKSGDFDVLQGVINFASENSVINLTHNYTYNQYDTITDGVLIDKNITINGNGFTIDAKGKTRIFNVTAGSINITNVTLKNGNSTSYGGAIYFSNDICNSNINATYINNTATSCGGANYFYMSVSNSNITGTYTKNAADKGGANYFNSVSDSNVAGSYINNTVTDSGIMDFMGELTNVTISNAIFLNNRYNEAIGIIFAEKSGLVAENNWFGNNATNYNITPNVSQNVTLINWLFLNATVNPTELNINETSEITFKLYSYNNSQEIAEYDASEMNMQLDLTQTHGTLSKNTALINETVTYKCIEEGMASVTAKFETASYTIILAKAPAKIIVNKTDMTVNVNESVSAGATLKPAEAGNLTYTSNNPSVVIVEDGKIIGIKEGNATITVSFEGNEYYIAAENKTINVTVKLNDASVSVDNDTLELDVYDEFTITPTTAPEGLNVTYASSDESVVTVDADGKVAAVGGGSATITVSVGGDGIYAENSTEIAVTVNKFDTILTVDDVRTVYNTTCFVVATLTDANGSVISGVKVKIVVDDLSVTALSDENGQVSLDITTLEAGEHQIAARSSGINPIYSESKAYAKATVYPEKLNTTLTVPDVYVIGNSSGVVVATLKDSDGKALSGIKVKIVVEDLSVIALTDEKGQVSLDISDLEPGVYKISARSSGVNDLYKEAKATAKAVVSEEKLDVTLTVPDVYVIGNSSAVVVATLKDSNGKAISGIKVKIVVDNLSIIAKTDANGQVSLDISGLAPGQYKISARSSGENYIYKEAKTIAKAIVSEEKLDATLTVPDVVVVGNSSGVVVATLKDSYGNLISGVKVKIAVDDLSITAETDENGQVSLDISGLAPGVHKISARSSGVSEVYNEAKAYAKAIISEEKINTTLTVPDVTVDGTSSALVVATLKDSYNYRVSGVKVKIVVGDLTKTTKTDENGQVSLDISDLAPGEYKISARSSGVSEIYNESKAIAKATVNAN